MHDIFQIAAEMQRTNQTFALATVVEAEGSVSAKVGAKAIIGPSGAVTAGWVGGGCAESNVCHTALECLRDGMGRVIDLDLDDEVLGTGMPCGGHMRVFIEPVLAKPTLWILGHGRVAECLCRIGALVGLRVVVIESMADAERFPDASERVIDDMDYSALRPTAGDFVVVATQHKGDHQSMKRALGSEVTYIGLIASKKRSRLVMDFLRENGFDEQQLSRVHAPCGLDLGCRTPEEIALSISSEIVMLREGGSGQPMRDNLLMQDSGTAEEAA